MPKIADGDILSPAYKLTQPLDAVRHHAARTMATLNETVDPAKLTQLSNKSRAEVIHLQAEISEIVPAGNVVSLVVSGLAQLDNRVISPERAKSDIDALMRGMEALSKTFYHSAVFGSPAAVLSAYQKILTLTGKEISSAFPEGLWQFYVEFSMREDSARHTCEAAGFQQALTTYNFHLPLYDQLTAWVQTVIQLYFQYDDLLLVEWSERTYLKLLAETASQTHRKSDPFFQNLQHKWSQHKPYRREQDAKANETYAHYRRRRFQNFCRPRFQSLSRQDQQTLEQTFQIRLQTEAPAFQNQLSLLSTLDPSPYREQRRPIPLWRARVAIIWQDAYHLLPACAVDEQGNPLCFEVDDYDCSPTPLMINPAGQLVHPQQGLLSTQRDGLILTQAHNYPVGRLLPLPFQQLRQWIWAIINGRYRSNLDATRFDIKLLQTPRAKQMKVRQLLNSADAAALELLKMAPVIINWDRRPKDQPLATIRLGRRGVGDQALTIFHTPQTMVFDQSHILFDGLWGLSVAEILTNEATSWAAYLDRLPPLMAKKTINATMDGLTLGVRLETTAEAKLTDLTPLSRLRQSLKQRFPDIIFTVNDVLILYRCLFNQLYKPNLVVLQTLDILARQHNQEAQAVRMALHQLPGLNPALLIPMDASDSSPKDRLYPISFRNPFPQFLDLFYQTYNALVSYQRDRKPTTWIHFSHLRRKLMREVYYFGQLMLHHKALSTTGQSTNQATLKLLGHLPGAVQSMLGKLPQKFDFMNELLKGEEVFSNVGRVSRGTSLTRFMSASDDHDAKNFVWGILTDDADTMIISLRDFRPEIVALLDLGWADAAHLITQDFLNDYVSGIGSFAERLTTIANAEIEEVP